jgi:LAO/AO transport system kinase
MNGGAPHAPRKRFGRAEQPTLTQLESGVRARDRALLGRAITLVESNNPADQQRAQDLLIKLLPDTGNAFRIGITGVPGVGKSTFIDAFGSLLTAAGHRVAVLAIDPTSAFTQGSILGDKTRMNRLSRDDHAFIRPSPSSGSLGGATRKTRESMLVCEAAGFDIVLVETVGVGQSETVVADMVDSFLILMLPGAGDDLQGIKRGILEHADVVAINKADQNPLATRVAQQDYTRAIGVLRSEEAGWRVPVMAISALTGDGLPALWAKLQEHRAQMEAGGRLIARRQDQLRRWMWSMVEDRVLAALRTHPDVERIAPGLEAEVLSGALTPTLGARALLRAFGLDQS